MIASDLWHRAARIAWDWASWALAAFLVTGARYDFHLQTVQWRAILTYVLLAGILQMLVGAFMKLYRGRYRNASFEESIWLAFVVVVVAMLLAAVSFIALGFDEFPRAMTALVPPIALVLMATGRWAYRARQTHLGGLTSSGERTLIYGAGEAGYQLIRLIHAEKQRPYDVVGFIDDSRGKRNLRLAGVPVLGRGQQLSEIAARTEATTVILAIAQADASLVRRVTDLAEAAGVKLLVLPNVFEMFGGRINLSDIREVDIADLLGRHQVRTDLYEIAGYVTGRRVLITGAGGSIGSELARQVHQFGPEELVLLDRDESALHSVQLSIYGRGLLDTPDMVLADIREQDVVMEVFHAHRPEVVFHAAALKHLPMLEQYPEEGWKTNVLGTLNVLRAASACGAHRFVNISTDKAADPTSVLGMTKRVAERLTAWYAATTDGTYLSVRFGNVLGSRGSMLPTFLEQIRCGGPVTVTHPDVTRYFMTIPEACELVIQAGAVGAGGEVLVLDMGEPVSINGVAERLIAQSGKKVHIVFTGLRPGEKMHEVLLSSEEHGERRSHPMITHVVVPPLPPSELPVGGLSIHHLREAHVGLAARLLS